MREGRKIEGLLGGEVWGRGQDAQKAKMVG